VFDIGFTEMMIIGVVALVVIGPERLPKVAKQVGEWIGKLRRYVDDVKGDISRQVELEELRKLKTQVTEAAQGMKSSVESAMAETQSTVDSLNTTLNSTFDLSNEAPRTDWDQVYANRRMRDRIKDRRIEREKELGIKRPKRALHR
jgi:sec-independent protein translocase protein TatB